MAHFNQPDHAGVLPDADGDGVAGALETGRYMSIQVRIDAGRITAARFRTLGCAPAIAAGDFLCEHIEGRTVEEAARWEPHLLIEALGGLPDTRKYCAGLAVDALRRALADAKQRAASR